MNDLVGGKTPYKAIKRGKGELRVQSGFMEDDEIEGKASLIKNKRKS